MSATTDDLATLLYGSTTPGPVEATPPAKAAAEPEAPAPDAEAQHAPQPADDPIYAPEVQYAGAIDSGLRDLADSFQLNEEQVAVTRRETAAVFAELQISPQRASYLHNLHTYYVREPASHELETGWRQEAVPKLREKYGDEAPERLKAAQAYVAKRKGLAQLLHHSGLGSHPDVVLEIADRAWALRMRQSLKGTHG